jgi:hypothetical protein
MQNTEGVLIAVVLIHISSWGIVIVTASIETPAAVLALALY